MKEATSPVLYTPRDSEPERRRIAAERIEALKLGSNQFHARVQFSDAHALSYLGRNAKQDRRITRMKMEAPTFAAVRIALQEADARVRLEEELPATVQWIEGAVLAGGFLDGSVLRFNRNLTCIIGGRGAGKSTAFEAVRTIATTPSASDLADSEAGPDATAIAARDEAAKTSVHWRIKGEDADPFDTIPIECYGQGETAETSKRSRKDLRPLLDYLDRFTGVEHLLQEDSDLRAKLLENESLLEKARREAAKRDDFAKRLHVAKSRLKALEAADAKSVVALERKLAEERRMRTQIEESLSEVEEVVRSTSVQDHISFIEGVAVADDLRVGAAHFRSVTAACATLRAAIKVRAGESQAAVGSFAVSVRSSLVKWKAAEAQILQDIQSKRQELAKKGITLDLQYIKKLTADESSCQEALKKIARWQVRLDELREARRLLIAERTRVRGRVRDRRVAFAKIASQHLSGTLGDLRVSVKFAADALAPDAEQHLVQLMGWRTVQVERAKALVRGLTVPVLLECARTSNLTPVVALKSDSGEALFSKSDAQALIGRVHSDEGRFRLEQCEVQDAPRITVTKEVSGSPVARDFSRLSLGQQQSVLLALMLSSDSPSPLLIDQPEDNLDGEFIYHSLVPALRRVKERRQVILVTHNANIAVLGDADQIIALKSLSDQGMVVGTGSIDAPVAKDLACKILEGSEEALLRRARMYGLGRVE